MAWMCRLDESMMATWSAGVACSELCALEVYSQAKPTRKKSKAFIRREHKSHSANLYHRLNQGEELSISRIPTSQAVETHQLPWQPWQEETERVDLDSVVERLGCSELCRTAWFKQLSVGASEERPQGTFIATFQKHEFHASIDWGQKAERKKTPSIGVIPMYVYIHTHIHTYIYIYNT